MELLDNMDEVILTLQKKLDGLQIDLNVQSKNMAESLRDLEAKIRRLEQGQLVYPDKDRATFVKDEINSALSAQGMEPDAKVFCELLYMNDPSWQDCVEACMGYRRFDILVSPNHYAAAKHTIEQLGQQVGRVRLLVSCALHRDREKSSVGSHSLASTVSSENLLARVYLNELLGSIVCCEDSSELEKHPHSATQDLLRHYPYRLARLKQQEQYIGMDARKKQLEDAR